MPGTVDARLADLAIELPDAPAPAANYVPWVKAGGLVFVSGQLPKMGDTLIKGCLGDGATVQMGQAAARLCGLALIAQVKAACDGDLDRVVRVVKLTGFVNATADFADHPPVINGASDLMVEVFGDAGRHARAAVGSASLPFGVMVEVEGVFEVA